MIENLENIAFHNLAEMRPKVEDNRLLLARYPEQVRHKLSPGGCENAMVGVGVELRFVSAAPRLRAVFSTLDRGATLRVYHGDYAVVEHELPPDASRSVILQAPERFAGVDIEARGPGTYHSSVWRIAVDKGMVFFHGLESFGQRVARPTEEQVPRTVWLAYGSSITQSWSRGYVHQAARRLKVDVLNKGLSGSCRLEAAAADYLAGLDWDLATLELGVNVLGDSTPEEFEKRVSYLLDRLAGSHPGAPVFVLTLFPGRPALLDEPDLGTRRTEAFNTILREQVAHRGEPFRLIEGGDVLSEVRGLSADLVHPSDFGHVLMGENLARLLRPAISDD